MIPTIGAATYAAGDVGVGSMITGVADGITAQIAPVLPIAGGILATIAGIFMGIKLFKKLTGARTS